MNEIFSLRGRKAFVTGASKGLGREIACCLAEAGADVALASRKIEGLQETAKIIEGIGRRALVCQMDIAKPDDIERAVNDALDAFGRIDILVNNAGMAGDIPVKDIRPQDWYRIMDVNLNGHVFCIKAVGRSMIENRYGKIINVASVFGLIGIAYNSAYCTTKAGLIHFTKVVALEWARYNIQVNALCPGYFGTGLNREFFKTKSGEKVLQKIPMHRIADTKEIRGVVLLLASDASSFMTGSVVVLDGGHTI